VKSHGRDTDPATVLSVTKMKLWVIAGVIGAASVAAVPAIDAYAYPPNTHLQVTVTPTGKPHEYTVSATNAGPGCIFRVVSGNVKVNTPVGTDGKASVTVDIGAKTGTRVILAKTITCKNKETTTTKVVTTTNQYKGPSSATVGEKITFKALGWNPAYPVVFTLSDGKGGFYTSGPLTPNSTGNVFWKTKTPPVGTYAVVVTQQGSTGQQAQIVINPKKKKKH
jgi:hypothetical protein